MIDLEMKLSDELNLGKWKIIVSGDQEVEFEVKKYVLPKFEVKIYHKAKASFKDKQINVQVCGK